MTFSAVVVTMIVSYLVPAAVALVTKWAASAWLKQALTALASAITGVIVTATQLDGTAVVSSSALVLALGAFLASQAAYVGLYKPHAVNAKLAPEVGLGPSSETPT